MAKVGFELGPVRKLTHLLSGNGHALDARVMGMN